jgi:hypothetical protein
LGGAPVADISKGIIAVPKDELAPRKEALFNNEYNEYKGIPGVFHNLNIIKRQLFKIFMLLIMVKELRILPIQ